MNSGPCVFKRKVDYWWKQEKVRSWILKERRPIKPTRGLKERHHLKLTLKKGSQVSICRNKGHIRHDYIKFQQWLVKKGTSISLVCYESNVIDVNHNLWWIDSSSKIHITNSLQDLRNLRKPVEAERSIYSRNKMQSHVEDIGTCNLVLRSGFI